jgi:DNA-binding transcriptional LysR family regulator
LKLHKDADVSVTVANTAQLLQQLDEGSIDFAILEGDYSRAAYSHIPFLTDQFVPICSSSHPFANTRRALSLTDLTGETLLIREPGSGTRSILEQALNSHDLAPSDFANLITIGNMNAIKEMTAAGAGITFLYETAVKSELKNGTIQKIPITSFDIRHEISIVWKKDNLFQEFFLDVFRELQFRT